MVAIIHMTMIGLPAVIIVEKVGRQNKDHSGQQEP